MGKFQVFVLISVVTCTIISTVQSVPVTDSSVESVENAAKCKKLCGFCGCTGYYCGDECLCECNGQYDGEAECVDTMKTNCKKLDLPFEVLIQGPNVNRMVRSLLHTKSSEGVCVQSSESNPKKRSTISIYKPYANEQQDIVLSAPTSHKDEEHDVHLDDSPIHVIAQHLPFKNAPVDTEPVYQEDDSPIHIIAQHLPFKNAPVDTEPVYQDDDHKDAEEIVVDVTTDKESNAELDRTNIKRHIIDINQGIADFTTDSDESFLHKRDVNDEVKEEVKEEEVKEEEVKEEDVGAAAPAAPATPAILLPKLQEAMKNIRAQIPTDAEIRTAWEGVRKDLNNNINVAIADAKKRAADLRDKVTPPPPTPPAPVKFNPFLRSENEEENDVGMALIPVVPAVPAIAPLAIQADIAKGIAQFRANSKLIQETARFEAKELINTLSKNRWLITPPIVGGVHEEDEEKKEEEVKEEEKKEE